MPEQSTDQFVQWVFSTPPTAADSTGSTVPTPVTVVVDLSPINPYLYAILGVLALIALWLVVPALIARFRKASPDAPKPLSLSDLNTAVKDLKTTMSAELSPVQQQLKLANERLQVLYEQGSKTQLHIEASVIEAKRLAESIGLVQGSIQTLGDAIRPLRESLPTFQAELTELQRIYGQLEKEVIAAQVRAEAAETKSAEAVAARDEFEAEARRAEASVGILPSIESVDGFKTAASSIGHELQLRQSDAGTGAVYQFYAEAASVLHSLRSAIESPGTDREVFQILKPTALEPALVPLEVQSEAYATKRILETLRQFVVGQWAGAGIAAIVPQVNQDPFDSVRHNKVGEDSEERASLWGKVSWVENIGFERDGKVVRRANIRLYVQPSVNSAVPPPVKTPDEIEAAHSDPIEPTVSVESENDPVTPALEAEPESESGSPVADDADAIPQLEVQTLTGETDEVPTEAQVVESDAKPSDSVAKTPTTPLHQPPLGDDF
jgi:hypothetical protein